MGKITAAQLAPMVKRALDRFSLGIYKKANTPHSSRDSNVGRTGLSLLIDGLVDELDKEETQ